MTPTFKKEDYLGTKYERPEREDVNVLRRYGDDQRRQLEGKRIISSGNYTWDADDPFLSLSYKVW